MTTIERIVLKQSAGSGWLVFDRPRVTLTASRPSDVIGVLRRAERDVEQGGLYAAGYVSYEAAAGFDAAYRLPGDGSSRLPLICVGLFDAPRRIASIGPGSSRSRPNWRAANPRDDYFANARSVLAEIAAGNSYQVNYTIRLRADGAVDAGNLFRRTAAAARYAAWIECGDHSVVSASPELFFHLEDEHIECQPMKGTCGRGGTTVDDRAARVRLQRSEKNRAENVMITDMIRNDLGRIAAPGSVTVRSLFDTVKLPTLWQMTSTVAARTSAPVSEIFAALFPCASITGAPKVASMRLIAAIEDSPREVYTGAIGYIAPGRRARPRNRPGPSCRPPARARPAGTRPGRGPA